MILIFRRAHCNLYPHTKLHYSNLTWWPISLPRYDAGPLSFFLSLRYHANDGGSSDCTYAEVQTDVGFTGGGCAGPGVLKARCSGPCLARMGHYIRFHGRSFLPHGRLKHTCH